MDKLLLFGNVAPFSLDTPYVITPPDTICEYGTCYEKTCFMTYANSKGAD